MRACLAVGASWWALQGKDQARVLDPLEFRFMHETLRADRLDEKPESNDCAYILNS